MQTKTITAAEPEVPQKFQMFYLQLTWDSLF